MPARRCRRSRGAALAALVGVMLFEAELPGLARQHERVEGKLALLPKAVRSPSEAAGRRESRSR